MEEAKESDPILNVVKSLLKEDGFANKSREEQWKTARKLLRKEKMNSIKVMKKSSL